jgi:hypothetical protein
MYCNQYFLCVIMRHVVCVGEKGRWNASTVVVLSCRCDPSASQSKHAGTATIPTEAVASAACSWHPRNDRASIGVCSRCDTRRHRAAAADHYACDDHTPLLNRRASGGGDGQDGVSWHQVRHRARPAQGGTGRGGGERPTLL